MKTKRCSRCKEIKPKSEFGKNRNKKDGLSSYCKKCNSKYRKEWTKNNPEYRKEYYKNNSEKFRQYSKKYLENNQEKERERKRRWAEKNPDKVRENNRKWQKKNPEKRRESNKEYHQKNPEKVKERQKKFLSIPKNRLSNNISSMIYQSLKGNKKGMHWEDLVDFTLETLRPHLEKQFKPDKKGRCMNWGNMGKGGWVIDHIKPIASFNFTSYKDKEFKKCWALKNLRPLWEIENLKKGAKY